MKWIKINVSIYLKKLKTLIKLYTIRKILAISEVLLSNAQSFINTFYFSYLMCPKSKLIYFYREINSFSLSMHTFYDNRIQFILIYFYCIFFFK